MRNIKKKQPMEGLKRVNINIETGLHNAFKAATAARGENMTDVLVKNIEDYVLKYRSPLPPKKGRRK